MENMSKNLAVELERLEQRIKEDHTVAKVVSKDGGGAVGVVSLALLALLALGNRLGWRKKVARTS